ncbi:hypothetical protein [Bacteroides sp. 224]|uniref:hypothetical protein n=1 Tax=Bacteroides sp. 224 TaxID=2302936 RepID=UPI0013D880DC|nr:hypothetical protein [Bacteroides sp. 224]NDV67022.1 hypothetical protein [Bacteroides sp. 224]
MKVLIFSISLLIACTFPANAQNRYEKRVEKYQSKWLSLIPTHSKLQFAGSIGLLSVGAGWDYGKKDQWETDLIVGIVPRYSAESVKATFTIKQNYIPWNIPLGDKGFSVDPLTCGLYMSTISGDDFWNKEPKKYPKGYYNISTKVRFHIYLGERISFKIPNKKRFFAKEVTFFYEVSTSDLYLASAFTNSYLKPQDYLSLALGLKFQFF